MQICPMKKRITSVDAFRGMTIALMILVNNPGTWAHIYPPFEHAEWFGITPTDWVFPFFLFIVGTSIVLAYHNRDTKNIKTYKRIITRTIKLILLGWFLAGFTLKFPFFKPWHDLRIPGVLVRIGIVFFISSFIYLFFKYLHKKFNIKAALAFLFSLIIIILAGYWYIMVGKYQLQGMPIDRSIEVYLNKNDNLASQIDRKILGVNHMWLHYEPDAGKRVQGNYDPEGLLSTLPSVATTLLGMLLGLILLYFKSPAKRILLFTVTGFILLGLSYLFEPYFPFSKKLWTSTFVLNTAGMAFLIYTLVYIADEFIKWKSWLFPFIALGMNAIAVFVLNGFIAKIFYRTKINGTSTHHWIYQHTWGQWIQNPETASLLYALTVVSFYTLLAVYLYRKKIFIKV
jgi:predicted acyltransferase